MSLGFFGAMLICAAALLGIGASAATAAPTAGRGWVHESEFSNGTNYPDFEPDANAIAVDGNGNVGFSETGSGWFELVGPDPVEGWKLLSRMNNLYRNVAFDPSDNALYMDETVIFGGSTVHRWVSNGAPNPTYTLDPSFSVPQGTGLVVDPATHDVLIADPGAEAIRSYDPAGNLVATISTSPIAPTFLAIVPDGSFYIASLSGPDVEHISSTGTVLGTISDVGSPEGLAWDSADEALVVAVTGERLKTYSAAGQLLSEVPSQSNSYGLAFYPENGHLIQHRPGGFIDYRPIIVPAYEAPTVSNVTPHGAEVETEVEPGEGPPTGSEAHFEYSIDGGTTWKSTPKQELTTPGGTEVKATLTGLIINSHYLVRVVASNSDITKTSSAVAFSTPETRPEVKTGKATDISETSAVINASINAAGLQTTYHFEFGQTAAYGSRLPAGVEGVAGNGREPRIFSRTIRGLEPGTTYHFRIVAENALGVSDGADQTFTTTQPGAIPHRVYEQVTPAQKNGVLVESGFGFDARADGNAFSYLTKAGKHGAPLNSRSVSYRGSTDWETGFDTDPPMNVSEVGIISLLTLGVSEDFSHALVASNRKLTPDAIEGGPGGTYGANLYLYDIRSEKYTLVASTPPIPWGLNLFSGYGYGRNLIASAPDFSWILFYSILPLKEGAPGEALYRWSEAGGLEVVSILPDETPTSVRAPKARIIAPWASSDGSRIYFQAEEGEQLTGVYLREHGETKALSVSELPGQPSSVQASQLFGASSSGRYAFFAVETNVPLTSNAPEVSGDVYRYDDQSGKLEYLGDQVHNNGAGRYPFGLAISKDGGTFYFSSETELMVWHEGELRTVSATSTPEMFATAISPNARYLVYLASDGAYYMYDLDTDESRCATCLPDGTPAEVKPTNQVERTAGEHLPRLVTDAGQFFFTSSSRLVAADVNGMFDVYEYKDGVDRLISPGNAPYPAEYADISENGSDVFFSTQQKLVGRDNDGAVDIYDARIDGGLAAQNPVPAQGCIRDDCKATPNAGPELPFGGSEALHGVENVTPPKAVKCAKGKKATKVKGKVRCVKQTAGKKKHRKSNAKHKPNKAQKGGNR